MENTKTTEKKAPATTKAVENAAKEQIDKLTDMVTGLKAQLDNLKSAPSPSTTQRKRTQEHVCTLREYENSDNEVEGIVLRIFDVKEVKDKEENKRFYCVSKLEVFDPRTKDKRIVKDVDYIRFLNDARKVECKIVEWTKTPRFETDRARGGGGTGPLIRQTATNNYVAQNDYEFEVGYLDHKYKLLINEGEFRGLEVETDEQAVNI